MLSALEDGRQWFKIYHKNRWTGDHLSINDDIRGYITMRTAIDLICKLDSAVGRPGCNPPSAPNHEEHEEHEEKHRKLRDLRGEFMRF